METSARLLAMMVLPALFLNAEKAVAAATEGKESVAIVSSVNGEAHITYPISALQPGQPKFRGPIVYGDHLSTGKDSSLGLLVGQSLLLTMRELSEARIAETVRNKQILEVAKGESADCLLGL